MLKWLLDLITEHSIIFSLFFRFWYKYAKGKRPIWNKFFLAILLSKEASINLKLTVQTPKFNITLNKNLKNDIVIAF